jgi:DNA (cytosine-5)-methyltransferase 1
MAPIWDDITTIETRGLPKIDIIYGGFPCTDISLCNQNGKGLEGERSGLFFEIMRIVDGVEPPFVFLENVPAISFRGLGDVAAEFSKRGYDMRWTTLSAYEVGAPHIRKRWWYLANSTKLDGWFSKIKEHIQETAVFKNDGEEEHLAYALGVGNDERLCESCRIEAERAKLIVYGKSSVGQTQRSCDHSWWEFEPNVDRVVNGLFNRVDRIRCLGNTVVPQQAKKAFEYLIGLDTSTGYGAGDG